MSGCVVGDRVWAQWGGRVRPGVVAALGEGGAEVAYQREDTGALRRRWAAAGSYAPRSTAAPVDELAAAARRRAADKASASRRGELSALLRAALLPAGETAAVTRAELRGRVDAAAGTPCRSADPELWWPADQRQARDRERARRLCGGCPVQGECLALGLGEGVGIWGGATAEDRRWLLAQLRRGGADDVGKVA